MIINNLPRGYTQLDYIESDNASYIDTGVKVDINTRIKSKNSFDAGTLFGVTDDNAEKSFIIAGAKGVNWSEYVRLWSSNGQRIPHDFIDEPSVIYELDVSSTYAKIITQDEEYEITYSRSGEPISNSLYLFARNIMGSASGFTTRKLFYLKIYEGEILIRDFIPCKRNSDNEIGLFDLVDRMFYENKGSGVFLAGNEVKKTIHITKGNNTIHRIYKGNSVIYGLPAEYTKLDYIENVNGSYIDTGVNADYHLDVDMIFRSSAGANFCFGAINRPFSSASYYDRYHTTNNNNKYSFFWGSENYMSMQFNQMDTEKHRFKTLITKSEVSLDDDVRTIGIYREVDTTLNYWLFKRNSNVSNLRYESKMKLYACKMWYKNELVRDFIPCKNQNNICGLYDLVEGKFYRSASNTDFEGGFETLNESEVS